MAPIFEDRKANRPNRYKVVPDSGNEYYVTLERADEPTVLGTPLNAANLNELYSPDNKPTPAEIGAAPAGFGLGEPSGKIVTTPDEAIYNGFYNVQSDNYNGNGIDWRLGWCSLLVERRGDAIAQTAKYGDTFWFRTSPDGGATWNTWINISPSAFAPAGYGLGVADSTPYCADANKAMTNGWYNIDGNTANGVGSGCVMRVDAWKHTWSVTQTAYTTNEHSSYYTIKQRWYWQNKGWTEWEYVNPPMIPGVEYRTTERHCGKAVYCKAINFGALPDSANKTVAHGITGKTNNLRFAIAANRANRMFAITGVSDLIVDDINVDIQTDRSLSFASVVFTLWYTKD